MRQLRPVFHRGKTHRALLIVVLGSFFVAGCASQPLLKVAPASASGASDESTLFSTNQDMQSGPSETSAVSVLAASCTGCHGASGSLRVLAGRRADTLERLMLAFRNGTRSGTLMPRLLSGYTESELSSLANYFSRQQNARQN